MKNVFKNNIYNICILIHTLSNLYNVYYES